MLVLVRSVGRPVVRTFSASSWCTAATRELYVFLVLSFGDVYIDEDGLINSAHLSFLDVSFSI